jgi:methionine salvage enolase-phosphatase E1
MSVSYSGINYRNSNKRIDEYLRKKRTVKQLSESGFQVVNSTIEKAYEKIRNKNDVWIFPPTMFKGYITQSGFKDKGEIYSHYGKVLKKWKLTNGNIYLYSTRIQILDSYRKVYVFTDKHRKVVKELWIA